jgi:hypothetical protein
MNTSLKKTLLSCYGMMKINNSLWTPERLSDLAMNIFLNFPDKIDNICRNTNMTSISRSVLKITLETEHIDVIRIFWKEFLRVQTQFKNGYKITIENIHIENTRKWTALIGFMEKNIAFDVGSDECSTVIEYIETNTTDKHLCKICFENNNSTVLVHDTYGCQLCSQCACKITEKCPFCMTSFICKIRLI